MAKNFANAKSPAVNSIDETGTTAESKKKCRKKREPKKKEFKPKYEVSRLMTVKNVHCM